MCKEEGPVSKQHISFVALKLFTSFLNLKLAASVLHLELSYVEYK
jgi:hypothetical protein